MPAPAAAAAHQRRNPASRAEPAACDAVFEGDDQVRPGDPLKDIAFTFDVSVADLVPPKVTGLSRLPDGGTLPELLRDQPLTDRGAFVGMEMEI